jgi:hypothetical protein
MPTCRRGCCANASTDFLTLRDSADAIISLEAMSKRTNATTMATEASKETASNLMEAEAAMQGYARPPDAGAKYRKPNQTRGARQRKEMIADFVAALGGNVSPIVLRNITRAVDLSVLASTARAELAAGKTTINDVVKLEGAADRAVRRLNLKPGAVANRRLPLRERLRGGAG